DRRRLLEQPAGPAGTRRGARRGRYPLRAGLRHQRWRAHQRRRRAAGLQRRARAGPRRIDLPNAPGDLQHRARPPRHDVRGSRRVRDRAHRPHRPSSAVLDARRAGMGEDLGRAVSDPDLEALGLKADGLRDIYRLMALTRRADLEATALQRQGELAVYPPLIGQEAAQVGSAYALEESDWIFPSYRELGAAVVRGIDLVEYLHFYRATWHGGSYDANAHRFGYVSVPVASQILHAVGYAMGAKLDGASLCTLAYFGDGATSEGDFHEG